MKALLIVISVLLLVAVAVPAHCWEPPTYSERALVERALECPNARDPDPFMLLRLLRLESHPDINVPHRWKGMSLSVACNESGYVEDALGDNGAAVGLYQLHHHHRGRCNLTRDEAKDGVASARCFLWRVRRTFDAKALRKCGVRRGWTAAWAWVAQRPSYRCSAWSRGHMSRLRRWKRGFRMTLGWFRGEVEPTAADLPEAAPGDPLSVALFPHRPVWGSDEP